MTSRSKAHRGDAKLKLLRLADQNSELGLSVPRIVATTACALCNLRDYPALGRVPDDFRPILSGCTYLMGVEAARIPSGAISVEDVPKPTRGGCECTRLMFRDAGHCGRHSAALRIGWAKARRSTLHCPSIALSVVVKEGISYGVVWHCKA